MGLPFRGSEARLECEACPSYRAAGGPAPWVSAGGTRQFQNPATVAPDGAAVPDVPAARVT